jgi:hypothetical protein
MRFDEGEERAARAAPVCSRPATPSPTGRASRVAGSAAELQLEAEADLQAV